MVELFTSKVTTFEFDDLSSDDVVRGDSGNDRLYCDIGLITHTHTHTHTHLFFTQMYLNVIKEANIIKCGCKE